MAGVIVQTLGGAAHEIMERAGCQAPGGVEGFDVLVRRLAHGETALATELESLSDGYDVVLGVIRDLVDAGFSPDHEDGVLERLDELAPVVPRSNRDRAAALVRVAARAVEAAEITGAYPQAARYQRAAEVLLDHGAPSFPSRGVLIHGFADLTGVAADLLTTVVQVVGGVVLVDRVPDPSHPKVDDSGNAFLERLELRLGGLEMVEDPALPKAPDLRFAEAPDAEAEARWVVETVRSLVASGAVPEEIGVVARHLGGLGPALRRQMHRLGIPFSGVGAQVPGGVLRRKARRLADLLRRGSDSELDVWVEVAEGLDGGAGLLLGLRVLSLARLQDLAALDPADRRVARGVPLPMGRVASSDEGRGNDRGQVSRLAKSSLVAAMEGARAVLEVLEGWPTRVTAGEHCGTTLEFLRTLGWSLDGGYGAAILEAINGFAKEFPDGLELDREEWSSALIRRLDGLGEVRIGGAGAGVQLLTVMEARARCFSHLLVCGLNRGVFPRLAVDDPLLPDHVRARLALDVLPEMPVKARSADEERYLFAQLVSSAGDVHLSWHLSADGRRMAPSPFVERLRTVDDDAPEESVPSLWALERARVGPRPAYEHAVLTAVAGCDGVLKDRLVLAVSEGREAVAASSESVPADRQAMARLDVLDAAEPGQGSPQVGPWFGFVASAAEPGDRLWVTHLEKVATCPWRAFLGRRLGVRPLPDPHLDLPDPDHRLVGEVVHGVLEYIVTGATDGISLSFEEALNRQPSIIRWPSKKRLERIIDEMARQVVFDEGLSSFGLAPLLAARVRPVLDVVKEVEWSASGELPGVLAAEVEGEIRSQASGRTIAFRADRLDSGPRTTDYKTGKPLSGAKLPKTREKHFLKKVETGRMLQAVAYALASPLHAGVGRYVYLRPEIGDTPPEARIVEVSGLDESFTESFDNAVKAIEASLENGAAFPRVDEPKGKKAEHCGYCGVSEACRRDDSDFRRRLVELMESDEEAEPGAVAAARELWWLGIHEEDSS